MLKRYYSLTKPGLIRGNAILAAAGFLFASHGHFNLDLFLAMLVGICLVIASGCVFNNYIDRHIDRSMKRTDDRALVTGTISGRNALVFAAVLGVLGILTLAAYTNMLTVCCALIGLFFYVVLYSPIKHRSVHGALVGSVAGAMPIAVGYCAVTNSFDLVALLLALMLIFWQMPHFYAIALYRFDDYKAASVPVFPVEKGVFATKIHMLFCIIFFTVTSLLLFYFGFVGVTYLFMTIVLGGVWIGYCVQGFGTINTVLWARRMFILSLFIIMTLAILLAVRA